MLPLDLKDISTPLQNKSILFQLLCSQAHTIILERLGLLPSELFKSEVSISSRLEVFRLLELEVADEAAGSKTKLFLTISTSSSSDLARGLSERHRTATWPRSRL